MNMESPADKYLREHSSRQSEALDWIEKQFVRRLGDRLYGKEGKSHD